MISMAWNWLLPALRCANRIEGISRTLQNSPFGGPLLGEFLRLQKDTKTPQLFLGEFFVYSLMNAKQFSTKVGENIGKKSIKATIAHHGHNGQIHNSYLNYMRKNYHS